MRNSGRADNKRRLHPIGGIGWVGILALLLLAALLAIEVWSTHGVLYEFYRLLAENTSSTRNITLYVASTLALVVLNLLHPSFGIPALTYLLTAFWISRRERLAIRFVAIPAWCFIETFVLYSAWAYSVVQKIAGGSNSTIVEYLPVMVACAGHAWLLWVATKSLRIPIVFLLIMIAAFLWHAFMPSHTRAINIGPLLAVGWRHIVISGATTLYIPVSLLLIHAAMCGVMIHWALRDRRKPDLSTECGTCGYSRTGLMADVCPECGSGFQSAPSPVPRSGMGEGGVRAT